jgi:nicotinate-nucleotide pyrophosphorylase (carboxylating)
LCLFYIFMENVMPLLPLQYDVFLQNALQEDLGAGDITSALTIPEGTPASGIFYVKGDGVLAGLDLAARTFAIVDPRITFTPSAKDGDRVTPKTTIAIVSGPARSLLTGERVALNILQQLSGVATLTHQFVELVAGTKARIVDTRKTTPLLRNLEKYAVRCGGGFNHRIGLYDAVLIKDNHLIAGGGVASCVNRARNLAPHPMKIEVECKTLEEVKEALAVRADILLLDNMTLEMLREAVKMINGVAIAEVSGGVNLQTVRAIAETGVDIISVGALTHSAPALDISLDLQI